MYRRLAFPPTVLEASSERVEPMFGAPLGVTVPETDFVNSPVAERPRSMRDNCLSKGVVWAEADEARQNAAAARTNEAKRTKLKNSRTPAARYPTSLNPCLCGRAALWQ